MTVDDKGDVKVLSSSLVAEETLLFMISAKSSSTLPTPMVSTAAMSWSSGSSESWSMVIDIISSRDRGRSWAMGDAKTSRYAMSGRYSFFILNSL